MKDTFIRDDKGRCVAIISGPDLVHQKITVNGKDWYFDFDKQFGPLWVGKKGVESKNQNPPEEVWDDFQEWLKNK